MIKLTAKTLLIGGGACARRIAEDLTAKESDLIVAVLGEDLDSSSAAASAGRVGKRAKVYSKTKVLSCRGSVGDFEVLLEHNGEKQTATVEKIIIAEEEKRIPVFSGYGLFQATGVISISRLNNLLAESSAGASQFSGTKSVVFLVGLAGESHPVITAEIMRACLALRADYKPKTYILTRNLKVAGDGLEEMYRETKKAGVVYFKFTDTLPNIRQAPDGSVRIEFSDEITGNLFGLTPDVTIVDEKIAPSDYTVHLAHVFELEEDLSGFAQGDNVHRLTAFTNRKGILVAGPSRGVQSVPDQLIDADNAALSLLALEKSAVDQAESKARIDAGKCVRCLTCYRLCPYKAVRVDTRVWVAPEACEGCGICAAECPRGAISMEDKQTAVGFVALEPAEDSFLPAITAFCCRRSAARAAELAGWMGKRLPAGLKIVEVPCGGGISLNHILSAFEGGADGVMVLTCHEGNCHSERGNIYAGQRVQQMKALFVPMGLESQRLVRKTLASNMGAEFAGALVEFEKQLLKMGSCRLKTGKT
jgi:quinone-modifying oxidoreductase subunit QmoB